MSISFASALSGAALGGALTYATVSEPRIILDQFSLTDWHMIRAFMTATAGSAVLTTVLARLKLFTPYVRPPITFNLFSRYDANIIGGLLIGTGMALTGACPGSVIPQLAMGVPSAWPTFLGALSGGLLWITAGEQLHKPVSSPQPPEKNTFHGRLGISYLPMLSIYVTGCLAVVAASPILDRVASNPWSGVRGGLAIALAQAVSMLATQNALCSSGAFEETARWIVWAAQRALGQIDSKAALPKPPPCSNAGSMFAVGEFFGAALLAKALGLSTPVITTSAAAAASDAQVARLFVGGAMLGFGARFAGGCTSGHGISGMSAMSVASLITVAAMFGGGMAVAAVVN